MPVLSHVFLSPGLFGFKRLGSYDYFCHVEAGIAQRFEARGRQVKIHVVDVHPTSSIRRRAKLLVDAIEEHASGDGPIHMLGHSTGGLDARLVASPTVNISGALVTPRWARRLRSVTSMNTPHYGTPLASFFATVSGQRLLYALSTLTVAALRLGAPPLALTSSLIAAFGRIDTAFGVELRLIDSLSDSVIRVLDDASSTALRKYLAKLRDDQGAIIQLSPESMDLFEAGVEDNPELYYQCTASYAPPPGVRHWARSVLSPWNNLSTPIFATLYRLTALENAVYPCEPLGGTADAVLERKLGQLPSRNANDGVVPLRSQIWGELVWVGLGDHLDVMGHFTAQEQSADLPHTDWLSSGAGYSQARFDAMLDAIVEGLLRSE